MSSFKEREARQERMQAVADSIGQNLADDLADIIRDCVDGYLMGARFPKEYAEVRVLAQLLGDTVLCWAVSEGKVGKVREQYLTTPEELADRELRAAQRQVQADTLRGLMGGGAPGQYL